MFCHPVAYNRKACNDFIRKDCIHCRYIEPYRNKAANLDDIRHMAFTDIDMAAYVILNDTLSYIRKTGRNIDTQTVDTYEYYKGIIKEREN